MNMAKAPKEEWERVMAWVNELEEEIKYPSKSPEECCAFLRSAPPMFRVVFGYQVLVDNCCDPNSDTLDWRRDLAAKFEEPIK